MRITTHRLGQRSHTFIGAAFKNAGHRIVQVYSPTTAKRRKLIVHTSGAVDIQEILKFTDNAGVFYPLQTFSKTKELNFWDVPLCIEGADETIPKHFGRACPQHQQ
jgi:hypothetical protein